MKPIELLGRVLFFGILALSEIALATAKHFLAKIESVIKSPL